MTTRIIFDAITMTLVQQLRSMQWNRWGGGTRWRSWLRHCATSRKVAGSIPDNTNEYHEYFLGGKGGRRVGLTILPPSCAECLEIWEPQPPWNPLGLSRPVMGLLYLQRHMAQFWSILALCEKYVMWSVEVGCKAAVLSQLLRGL